MSILLGPANDLNVRAMMVEQHSPPEILVHGLVSPADVNKLFEMYVLRCNYHYSVMELMLFSLASTND